MTWILEIAFHQKKPYLSEKYKLDRLKFSHAHKNWSFEDWRNVI